MSAIGNFSIVRSVHTDYDRESRYLGPDLMQVRGISVVTFVDSDRDMEDLYRIQMGMAGEKAHYVRMQLVVSTHKENLASKARSELKSMYDVSLTRNPDGTTRSRSTIGLFGRVEVTVTYSQSVGDV